MPDRKKCACGCGDYAKRGNKYIHGHNRRGLASNTRNGRWARDYDCCKECGTTKVKHTKQGYCSNCIRKLQRAGLVEKKDLLGGRWSKKYSKCKRCGTTSNPHHANGYCGNCLGWVKNREKGITERTFGGWSWYYDRCQKCGTTDTPHVKGGFCVDCFEEMKRLVVYSEDDLDKCPVCGYKVKKLEQHVSMKAKRCGKHLEYYRKDFDTIVKAFRTKMTSQDVANKFGCGKRKVLDFWHEVYSDEDIVVRGEKVRVSKISGKNNYLFGKTIHLRNSRSYPFIDRKGRFFIMRSSWEVYYAIYLDECTTDWEYEAHSFMYTGLEGNQHFYFPDFYLPLEDVFVEIKGMYSDRAKHKIQYCEQYYGLDIRVIGRKELKYIGIIV